MEGFLGAQEGGRLWTARDLDVKGKDTSKMKAQSESDVMTAPVFLEEVGRAVDGINFLELKAYLQKSKVCELTTDDENRAC